MKWNLPPNNKKTHNKSKNRSALYKKQSLVVKNLFFFGGVLVWSALMCAGAYGSQKAILSVTPQKLSTSLS